MAAWLSPFPPMGTITVPMTNVDRWFMELAMDVCLGCASEEHDEYLDRADCVCHERGYN